MKFPSSSIRQICNRSSIYRLVIHGWGVLNREGVYSFVSKTGRYLWWYIGRVAWGRANTKGMSYPDWIDTFEHYEDSEMVREITAFTLNPKVSIITPVYNCSPALLDRCVSSVLGQAYENWELCMHDDGSTLPETLAALKTWAATDSRIKVSFGSANEGISSCSNQAMALSEGTFVGLLDQDDELSPNALYEVAKLLNKHPDTDLAYSDEDKLIEREDGSYERTEPFFKPDWDPHLLMASMYTGHFSVYRKALVEELGGFRSEFDFSQDYDLALRVTERTNRIRHIRKILYHWRATEGSAAANGKSWARESNLAALRSAVERRGYDAEVMEYPFANRVRFAPIKESLVSVVIPTDSKSNAVKCISRMFAHTAYRNFEVIVVTTAKLGGRIKDYFGSDARIRICEFNEPFNFSKKCNDGVDCAEGEYVLFLNDDVLATHDSWIEDMIEVFEKGNVGAVGARMFYDNGTIQHAGMVTGVRGLIGTAFHCWDKDTYDYYSLIQSPRNVTLLSGACMMMRRTVFEAIGGFDEVNTPIMDSDVDLCFRLKENGYELIYQPFAALRHSGHRSIRRIDNEDSEIHQRKDSRQFIFKKWSKQLGEDPYYTPRMREFLYESGDCYYRLYGRKQTDALGKTNNCLLVSHELTSSGAPLLLYWLACDLVEHGYAVTVLSPVEGDLKALYRSKDIPVMIDRSVSEKAHSETAKFVATFDTVVVNTIDMYEMVHVAHKFGVPIVWWIHESGYGYHRVRANPRVARALDLASAVVLYCRRSLSEYGGLTGKADFRYLKLGAMPLRESDGRVPKESAFSILCVGSTEPRKGQDVLVDAIERLPSRWSKDITVYLVGRVLDEDFHYKVIEKANRSAFKFVFVGEVPREDLALWYDSADLIVCPSRDETGPLTVIEAMSRGRAVICTRVGSVDEMIQGPHEGIIVEIDDAAAIAESIKDLYRNDDRRAMMGERAREKFRANLRFDGLADGLRETLRECLEKKERNRQ